jgi:hypothetical protein
MARSISKQHPAVVLRSQYEHLRVVLVAALVAVVALAAVVVILAASDSSSSNSAQPSHAAARTANPSTRYDGGPEEGTRGPFVTQRSLDTRYDGGPEEGTRGPGH